MDARQFDELARTFSAAGTRRGLVRLLSVLPLAGWLALVLGDEKTSAKRRQDRGKERDNGKGNGRAKDKRKIGAANHKHEHRRRKHRNKGNHHKDKDKDKKKCKPESTAQTCGGQCGQIKNNCQKTVDCGSCECAPACAVCQVCNAASVACEADPAQAGDACGACRACSDSGGCEECAVCCDDACCAEDAVCHAQDDTCCVPESFAETCDGQCGPVDNNCGIAVACGSCICSPACPVCRMCNAETVACEPDPAQVGESCGDGLVCQADGSCACQENSCGGCRACEAGLCVPDASVVCTPSDQCHEAGVCDPQTGECTNPVKPDDTPCEAEDLCIENATCQHGVCTGDQKNCSSEDDVCNDGVCRSADGACIKRPKQDGAGCNADNTDCTAGDSCQNGVCTPGAGIDCRSEADQCNRGVCRQSDGACIKEPRQDGTACATGNPCTQPDTCQNGACVAGPQAVCTATDECHLAGTCNPSTGFCSNPAAPDDTPCGINGTCQGGVCEEICLITDAICDPGNDTCCGDEGAFCSETAACADGGEGRCCRDEGAACDRNCDCCAGVCAGGVCCQSNQQCNVTSDCCEGFICIDTVCTQTCGTNHAICTDIPCCDGFRCVNGECSPNTCQALTESCSDPGQCCQEGGTTCAAGSCCQPFNQPCDQTAECCGGRICGPQGRCCQGSFFDPERPQARGCVANGGCCPGRRCDPKTDTCCLADGQPVSPPSMGGELDCCHFTAENGVCVCRADGQVCATPLGHPFVSNCCDGLICVDAQCQPPCSPWDRAGCGSNADCCRGHTCEANGFCSL